MIKSPIAYPGAKGKVCDKLMQMIPFGITDWREPFFGGGSVTIAFLQSLQGQECEHFTVGDLYKEVFYFWQSVQQAPEEMKSYIKEWYDGSVEHIGQLRALETTDSVFKEIYELVTETEIRKLWDWVKSVDVETLTPVQRGARFYLSSKMSFSGVADSGGMSKENAIKLDTNHLEAIDEASSLLQRVNIYNQSFEKTMANTDKDKSFIFLDPPYITQEVGHLYGRNGSTHNGFPHELLAELCMNANCKWLMTIDDCVRARRLYKGAIFNDFYIPYTMTSLMGREGRLNGEELLISNYDINKASNRVGESEYLASKFGF